MFNRLKNVVETKLLLQIKIYGPSVDAAMVYYLSIRIL